MDDRTREKAGGILPTLRDKAAQADRDREISQTSVEQLAEAGAFRMLVPRRFGGSESDLIAFVETIRDISGACGSTGWLVSWFGVHSWHLSLFPVKAQDEVWETGPDALVTAAYAATGHVVEVRGGFRIQGRWSWATGCRHAGWALLGGMISTPDGAPADLVTFLVPMTDLRVEANWDTVGLRGIGSHDLVADDVYVPAHRSLSFAPCLDGTAPGLEANPGVLYRVPLPSVFAAATAAPVIGMAEGAYAALVGWLRTRLGMAWSGLTTGSDDFSNAHIGGAAADLDASWLQIVRDLRELTRHAEKDEPIPWALRRRIRRDQVVATRRAADAVDRLFEHSGGEMVRMGHPIEQAWRNIHTVQAFGMNDLDRTLAMYGAGELNVGAHPPMV
ncbi:acyl-CoA dehydrogenase family protein [Actinomadura rudentiformis]|uniref:Flavin-dependent monooxygenase n=1 Tax=Actinomadura rudentiformis TaxID=359158 RepID=A0A6H9YNU6_9ACTN|nr:acyl-CoA dehydrogenase family protein [Actinomadura rudentiformis]KAB2341570.1 flavin-dependent monooxygenase [Actinomadura rudentiformis]